MMIFYRNAGSILRKIRLKILFQPHFDYRNNLFSSFLRSITNRKSLFSWFTTEKSISPVLKNILNLNKTWRYERVLGLLSVVNIPTNIGGILRQPLNHFIKTQTWTMVKPLMSGAVGSYLQAQSVFERTSQPILHRVNSMPHKGVTNKFWMLFNKSLTKRAQSSAPYSMTEWRKAIFNKNSQDFYFHKRQSIEQEVEEIKRIVVEAKEAVVQKSTSTNYPGEIDIKQHFDINRISDQVYQNIERRVRMERERRGL
jgi:hypothetical protein